MKLLRILPSLNPEHGGVAAGVTQIIPALLMHGIETSVVTLDSPSSPFLLNLPFNVYPLGPGLGKYGFKIGLIHQLREIIHNFDAIIIDGIWQFHSIAAWRASKLEDKSFYVFTHGMLDPWFKKTYPLKHLKKWAYWPWADYQVLRDAKAVLFTTDQERLLAKHSFWLYDANELVVGFGASAPPPDAVEHRSAFLQRFPHLNGKRILLFLSRIHPKKGVDLLIDAFAAVANSDSDLHLVIAGPDPVGLKAVMQQRAKALDISKRITWAGMLSGHLKWGAYHCAELFCLPSHGENFGVVVAEALACGLPVSISEPVNISTEVLAAGAGIVHKDTTIGTTSALRTWLTMSSTEKTEMCKQAQQLYSDSFAFSSVTGKLVHAITTK